MTLVVTTQHGTARIRRPYSPTVSISWQPTERRGPRPAGPWTGGA